MSYNISIKNRILIFTIIFSMAFLCAFSYNGEPDTSWNTNVTYFNKSDSAFSSSSIKTINANKILEINSGSRIKVTEETTRIKDNKKSNDHIWYIACIFAALTIHFLSVCIHFLVKSDLTPRYSIISYLHRSDGKKSSLSAA